MDRGTFPVVIFLLALCEAACAENLAVRALRGVTSIKISVPDFDERIGGQITPSILQTAVALRLRAREVPVIEGKCGEGCALFSVHLMLKQTPEQTYIFALFASVSEVVRRVAPPHQTLLATTWEANHAGMIGDLRVHRIQETVIELTDQFLADYRAANRPGQTFSPELLPEKNTKK